MDKDQTYLLDIYQAASLIMEFTKNVSVDELKQNQMLQSAVLYQLLVLGEATKRLSEEFRAEYPELPWRQMAAIRDVVAHQYDRLDFGIISQVVYRNIPELTDSLSGMLDSS